MAGYAANLPDLQASARSGGHINPYVDPDGVCRRVPVLEEYQGSYYEAFAVAMVRSFLGSPPLTAGFPEGIGSGGSGYNMLEWLGITDFRIPVDKRVTALIPYRSEQGSFKYLPAVDVLNGRIKKEELEGAIVVVGTSAAALMDVRSTPVSPVYPGVEIHANMIAGILDQTIKYKPAYVQGVAITARGGSITGNGGIVETSGHKLSIGGAARVNTGADHGQTGSWLLDPTDFTIAATGGDITGTTLSDNLATTDVTILNSSGAGGVDGDIFVNDTVSWTSSHTLTLNAYRNIEINNTITGGGNLVLRADSTGTGAGTVTFAGYGAVTLTGGAASVYYNPSGGYASPTDYSGNFALSGGATLTTYMLVNNINDLQAINNNLSGTYALGKDIDAGATATWNSGRGFIPIGRADTGDTIDAIPLTFDGNGHTISNLFINRPSQQYIGLFGGNGSPTIRYLWLENVNVTGGFQTAGAIAHTDGITSYSYVTGTVHGTSMTVGGLIALNAGQIDNCYSTAAVTSGGSWVGGLVGAN